jgi:dual specificity tyrosine-phosphorylation-regulated kinase 2/3/4
MENIPSTHTQTTSSPKRLSLKALECKRSLKPNKAGGKLHLSENGGRASKLFNTTKILSRKDLSSSLLVPAKSEFEFTEVQNFKPKNFQEKMSEGSTVDTELTENTHPMHPSVAIKKYRSQLTAFEVKEITEVSQVYFLAPKAQKQEADPHMPNDGFDTEQGFYRVNIGDHIAFRYEILSSLGKGAFGQVIKAFDYKRSEAVAIKIIRNSPKLARQAGIEIKVLNKLRAKDAKDERNVVKMKNFFVFRNHVCITFELLSLNLYDFLRANQFRGIQMSLIRRIAVQLLIALSLLKHLDLIHCDLKPENVVFKQPNKTSIKLIDFGASCLTNQQVYTYIQSRFYRAPETILQLKHTRAIDMWSFGCILAELLTGKPIYPGDNEVQMLMRMQELFGPLPAELAARSPRRRELFREDLSLRLIPDKRNSVRKPGTSSLSRALKCDDENFIDFLGCCFTWDPAHRIQPDDALKHPWIVGEKLNSSVLFESSSCSKSAKQRMSRSMRN